MTSNSKLIAYRMHGTGIYTHIWFICMVNVGKYIIHWIIWVGGKSVKPCLEDLRPRI